MKHDFARNPVRVFLAVCAIVVFAGASDSRAADLTYDTILSKSLMPLPTGYAIVPGGCPGPTPQPAACADSTMRVYVNADRVLDPTSNGFTVLVHELGHIVDFDNPGLRASTGLPLEAFADVYAMCATYGPNTLDPEIVTPVYAVHVDAATYRAACQSIRAAVEPRYGSPPSNYQPTGWRRMPRPGDCVRDGFAIPCQAKRYRLPPRLRERRKLARLWSLR